MRALVAIFDVVVFAGFAANVAAILSVPVHEDSIVGPEGKWFMAATSSIFAIIGLTNFLEDFSWAVWLDPTADYVVLLFVPFTLYCTFALYSRQQVIDARRAYRHVVQSSDMMMSIADTTPAGVIVLDASGRLSYANGSARALLDLEDDPDTGAIVWPGWTVHDERPGVADAEGRGDFSAVVTTDPQHDVPLSIEWPNGWRIRVSLSTAPMLDAQGGIGGVVASFVQSARQELSA